MLQPPEGTGEEQVRCLKQAIGWLRQGLGAAFEPVRDATAAQTPLRRVATPEDVAQVILALIESADFVTGQTVVVDGGNAIRA
ncbi:MAG: SDR family oxidoreductase [Planctomycetota bacterium]